MIDSWARSSQGIPLSRRAKPVLAATEKAIASGSLPWIALVTCLLDETSGAHFVPVRDLIADVGSFRDELVRKGRRNGPDLRGLVARAEQCAASLSNNYVGCEHLFLAAVELAPAAVRPVLDRHGISPHNIIRSFCQPAAATEDLNAAKACHFRGYDLRGTSARVCPECGRMQD